METPKNPFILGHRIHRPYFCDREQEQATLTDAVVNGRNLVLLSPRRMGKTSLIRISLEENLEIRDKYLIFFVDILQSNSLSEFTYLLGKAVFDTVAQKYRKRLRKLTSALKSLSGSFGFDPITGLPTFNIQLGDIRNPEFTLEEIFSYLEHSEKPVIIAIDEFQQVTKYPEKNTEAILREQMQRSSNTTFIFAGSEFSILQEMFNNSKRPFYNSSDIMHLDPINEDYYVEFAKSMFEQRDRWIDPEAIRRAYRLFNGNTFYIQRTMNGAFSATPPKGKCGEETVDGTIRAMLAANDVLYREILSTVSINQKTTLIAIAKEGVVANPMGSAFIKKYVLTSASSVQSALQKLMKSSLISKTPEGYTLTDPLLRMFVNHLYGISEI